MVNSNYFVIYGIQRDALNNNATVLIYHTILHHYMFLCTPVNIARYLLQNDSVISSLYGAGGVFYSLT